MKETPNQSMKELSNKLIEAQRLLSLTLNMMTHTEDCLYLTNFGCNCGLQKLWEDAKRFCK